MERPLSCGRRVAPLVDREETRVRTTLQQLDTGQNSGGTLASVGAYPAFVLSGLALCAIAALVTALVIAGYAYARGGLMYNPGPLNAQS